MLSRACTTAAPALGDCVSVWSSDLVGVHLFVVAPRQRNIKHNYQASLSPEQLGEALALFVGAAKATSRFHCAVYLSALEDRYKDVYEYAMKDPLEMWALSYQEFPSMGSTMTNIIGEEMQSLFVSPGTPTPTPLCVLRGNHGLCVWCAESCFSVAAFSKTHFSTFDVIVGLLSRFSQW
jgi:hypothetical protein